MKTKTIKKLTIITLAIIMFASVVPITQVQAATKINTKALEKKARAAAKKKAYNIAKPKAVEKAKKAAIKSAKNKGKTVTVSKKYTAAKSASYASKNMKLTTKATVTVTATVKADKNGKVKSTKTSTKVTYSKNPKIELTHTHVFNTPVYETSVIPEVVWTRVFYCTYRGGCGWEATSLDMKNWTLPDGRTVTASEMGNSYGNHKTITGCLESNVEESQSRPTGRNITTKQIVAYKCSCGDVQKLKSPIIVK